MGFFDPFGGAADVDELKSDLSSLKSDVETHTNNNDIHVTASDKSNWDSKLDKNQGSENSGKVLGTNANGEVIPLNGYGFEYDEETKMLKYGTDPTSNLNQGIGLDDTLSKRGYAADAGAVGELKEDLNLKDVSVKRSNLSTGYYIKRNSTTGAWETVENANSIYTPNPIDVDGIKTLTIKLNAINTSAGSRVFGFIDDNGIFTDYYYENAAQFVLTDGYYIGEFPVTGKYFVFSYNSQVVTEVYINGEDYRFYTKDEIDEIIEPLDNATKSHIIASDILPSMPYNVYRKNGVYSVDDIYNSIHNTIEKTFYVDKSNGSDSNDGLTESTAWASILKAISYITGHGYNCEVIILGDDVYENSEIFDTNNNNQIRFRQNVIIRAKNRTTFVGGVSAKTNGYTNIDGNLYSTTLSGVSGCVLINDSNMDAFGIHKPMTKCTSLQDVTDTDNSYFIDGTTVYINSSDIDNVYMTTNTLAMRTIMVNAVDSKLYFENITFVGRTYFVGRSVVTAYPNNICGLIVKNCIAEHCFADNNFTQDSWDYAYFIDCKAGYAKLDNFNHHAYYLNNDHKTDAITVEVNCFGEFAGIYNANGYSDNISTAHDSMNILRCCTNGYEADGSLIADIDGCHSVCIECNVINRHFTSIGSAKGVFYFAIATNSYSGRDSVAIVQDCHGYDVRELPEFKADNLYGIGIDFSGAISTNLYVLNKKL